MKNHIKLILIAFLLLMVYYACKEDEGTGVDFSNASIAFENTTESFFMDALTDSDSTYQTRAIITNFAPQNVNYTVDVNAASTAVEGTEFNILNKTITIQPGYISAYIEIQLLDNGLDPEETKTLVIDILSADVNLSEDIQCTITIGKNAIPGMLILDEGFEGGTLPAGWLSVDNDGKEEQCGTGDEAFAVLDWGSYNGSYSATSCSFTNPFVADNFLILPSVDLTIKNKIHFVATSDDPDWPNNCHVYISTTTNDVGSFTTQIYDGSAIPAEWTEISVEIPDTYDNSTVYIAFRDDSDGWLLYLDNVQVEVADVK